jgi:hypothetical protein
MPEIEKKKIKCPCCFNYYEVDDFGDERYIGEICPICYWQYDIVGQEKFTVAIGPNSVSLNKARQNYIKFGASVERFKKFVRNPLADELPENNE